MSPGSLSAKPRVDLDAVLDVLQATADKAKEQAASQAAQSKKQVDAVGQKARDISRCAANSSRGPELLKVAKAGLYSWGGQTPFGASRSFRRLFSPSSHGC